MAAPQLRWACKDHDSSIQTHMQPPSETDQCLWLPMLCSNVLQYRHISHCAKECPPRTCSEFSNFPLQSNRLALNYLLSMQMVAMQQGQSGILGSRPAHSDHIQIHRHTYGYVHISAADDIGCSSYVCICINVKHMCRLARSMKDPEA